MSVTHPVDSGGGGGSMVAVDREKAASNMFEEMAQQMQDVGDWAKIMEQEYVNNSNNNNLEDDSSVVVDKEGTPRLSRHIPEAPPFKAQVANIDTAVHPEQLGFFFGGDDVVKDIIEVDGDRSRATIEFEDQQGLIAALEKNGTVLGTKEIKVYVIRNNDRPPAQIAERKQFNSNDGRRSNEYSGGYTNSYGSNRYGSQYNSQSSLYSNSNDARNSYGNRRGGGPPDHYRDRGGYSNTLPNRGRGAGGYGGNQQHSSRNEYGSYGGGGRGTDRYTRGGSGGGSNYENKFQQRNDFQRTSSYTHDRHYPPGPVSRSRTDSVTSEQYGRHDMQSRNSSRLSTETETSDIRAAPVKKTTSKDIFGEAKPVDTEARIREVEERREKERQERAQREKDEAAAVAAAHQAANDHYKHSHHRQHHGRHHAPSPNYHNSSYENQNFMISPTQDYSCRPPQFTMPYVCPPSFNPEGPVTILQRPPQPSVEAVDSSFDNAPPPIDPHHHHSEPVKATSFEAVQENKGSFQQHMDEKPADSVPQDKTITVDTTDNAARMTSSHHSIGSNGDKFKKPTYRTFHRSNEVQKSDSSHYAHERPIRVGHSTRGRGGRGGGGGQYERRSSYSFNEPKAASATENTPLITEQRPTKVQSADGTTASRSSVQSYNIRQPARSHQEGNTLPRPEKKEHHSSRSSLRGGKGGFDHRHTNKGGEERSTKGTASGDDKSTESGRQHHHSRGNYGGRGAGAGPRNQQNRRSSRTSTDDTISKTTVENQHKIVDSSQQKTIVKEEFVPQVATGRNGPAGDASSKTVEVVKTTGTEAAAAVADNTPKEKKKDKKKNKNQSSKTSTALTGNKFALLDGCDD